MEHYSYRVFMCNCHFSYLSDGHLKTKKSYNPIIFVNLTYGHFDILRSQYGQVKKVVPLRSVPKQCYGYILQGLRTQNTPEHIQFPLIPPRYPPIPHRHHSDTPDIPQTPPRYLHETRDTNRCQQTPPDILKQHLSVSWGVWGWLFVSIGVCCHLLSSLVPLRCLGGVWGDIWGVFKEYLSGIHGNFRCMDVFGGYLGSQPLQYGAVVLFWHRPEKHHFFSPDHTETSKYQNVHI